MSKIITHGATMYCSLGTEKPNLTVTSQTFRRIADALVGTEGDNERQYQWDEKADGAVILYVC